MFRSRYRKAFSNAFGHDAPYRDAAKWHQIYEANKAIIGSNPDHIEVGQELTLPSL